MLRPFKNRSQRQRKRLRSFEKLEERRVLAAAVWHNISNHLNVSGDEEGYVTPLDALLLINELNVGSWPNPLPQQIEDSTESPPFFDTSCDGFVSPIDALLVINHLNANPDDGPTRGSGIGTFPELACSPTLQEGNDFVTELSRVLTLPSESTAVEFLFRAPEFDSSSQHTLRDAFEIEVTDLAGNPVAFAFAHGRETVFNWSEQLTPIAAPGSVAQLETGDADSTITINLSGVEAGSQVVVTARLINNDGDQDSSVIIRGFELTDSSGQVSGVSGSTSGRSTTAVDFEQLSDVTGSVRTTYLHTSYGDSSEKLKTSVQLINQNSFPLDAPLLLVVEKLSEPTTQTADFDGWTADGKPYFDFSDQIANASLLPGEVTGGKDLTFLNRSETQFEFEFSFLAALNSAPEILSAPHTEAILGQAYSYPVDAKDANDDPLTYRLLLAPEGMSISDGGEIQFTPNEGQIGNHSVVVEVTDGRGGKANQSFNLAILKDPPNRPPRFVSVPVTHAEFGRTYNYVAETSDPDNDSISFRLLNAPSGMSINPETGAISWVPSDSSLTDVVHIAVEADDGRGGRAFQEFDLAIVSQQDNSPPVFVSSPVLNFELSESSSTATGDVSPDRITLQLNANQIANRNVSITLPDISEGVSHADIVFAVDESGSMAGEHRWLEQMVVDLDQRLLARGIGPNRFMLVGYGGAGFKIPPRVFASDIPNEFLALDENGNRIFLNLRADPEPGRPTQLSVDFNAGLEQVLLATSDQPFETRIIEQPQPLQSELEFGALHTGSIAIHESHQFDFSLEQERLIYLDIVDTTYLGPSIRLDGPGISETSPLWGPFSSFRPGKAWLLSPGDYSFTVFSDEYTAPGDYQFTPVFLEGAPQTDYGIPYSTSVAAGTTQALRFAASAGDLVEVDFSSPDSSTKLRLLDPFGREIQIPNGSQSLRLQFGGHHTLLFEKLGNGTSGEITINVALAGSDRPPGFSGEQLDLGDRTSGGLASGESTSFIFELVDDTSVVLDSITLDSSAGSQSGLRWSLDGPRGNVFDDSMYRFDGLNEGRLDLVAGQYQITIANTGNTDVSFGLAISELSAAPLLTLDEVTQSILDPGNSIDAYRFSVSAGDEFFLDVPERQQVDWQIVAPLGEIEVEGGEFDLPRFSLQQTGEYTLFVVGKHNAFEPVEYEFTLYSLEDESVDIELGQEVTANVSKPGEVDLFRFTVTSNEHVVLQRDSNATEYSISGPDGLRRENSSRSTILRPGEYTLMVDGRDDATTEYNFQLFPMSAANSLVFGTTISGSLNLNRSEYYRFDALAGQTYHFEPVAVSNIRTSILDSAGVQKQNNASQGRITFTPQLTGTYFLKVDALGAAATYEIAPFEVDYQTAELATISNISSTIDHPGDIDRYTFQLDAWHYLGVGMLDSSGKTWELRDNSGVVDDGNLNAEILHLPPGDYSFDVSGSSGDYSLELVDFVNANQLTLGNAVEVAMDGQVTAHRFVAEPGDFLRLDLQPNPSFFFWRVFDETGQELRITPGSEFEIFSAGTYWLTGQRHSTNSTSFSLTLERIGNETPLPFDGVAIVPGEVVTGELSVAGEVDLFAFTLESDEWIYLDGLPTNASDQGFSWRLVSKRGTVSSGRFSDTRDAFRLAPGHYQVQLEHQEVSTGPYSFRVGTLANGEPIEADSTITTELPNGNDSHVYNFDAAQGDELQLETISGSGQLTVFDPYQRKLFNSTSFSSTAVFRAPVAGTYTMLVNGYPANYDSQTLQFVLHRVDSSPTAIDFEEVVGGSIDYQRETDRYSFSIESPQRILIDGLASSNTVLSLFDPFGNTVPIPIANSINNQLEIGTDTDSSPLLLGHSGVYTIEVEGRFPSAVGPYTFRILDFDAAPIIASGDILSSDLNLQNAASVFRVTPEADTTFIGLHTDRKIFDTASVIGRSAESLVTTGALEDGFWAISKGLGHGQFRPETARNVVLITDEPRTELLVSQTLEKTLLELDTANARLTTVANARLQGPDGQFVLGLDSKGLAYSVDDDGNITSTSGGTFGLGPQEWEALSFATDGSVWDLNQLRSGGDAAAGFSEGFVEIMARGVEEQIKLDVIASDPAINLTNLTGVLAGTTAGETANFDVQFEGDGLPHEFDLLFVRPDSQAVIGSIPVEINSGYFYPVQVVDPDGDRVTFDLLAGPAGAEIDVDTGRIDWSPTQAGSYDFEIRARDERGGTTTQAFSVSVGTGLPNQSPNIDSTAPVNAIAGLPYEYQVSATDADADTLSYFLIDSPEGMSIDRFTGLVQWNPSLGDLGEQNVAIRVVDVRGGPAEQIFSISVQLDASNNLPEFLSTPSVSAAVEEPFHYPIEVSDQDGEPLELKLVFGPDGAALDADQNLVWTPTIEQVGLQTFILRLRDSRGGTALQTFDVTAIDPFAPVFTSLPIASTQTEVRYSYPVQAVDANNTPLTYQLEQAPEGMTIDSQSGLIEWTPASSDLGQQLVEIMVTNEAGRTAGQTFLLSVFATGSNSDPTITSTPRDYIQAGNTYLYQPLATDPDNDRLTLNLVTAPPTMEISSNGVIKWQPAPGDIGTHDISLRLTDGRGGVATQSYELVVGEEFINSAPQITSDPRETATVGDLYHYDASAADEDNDWLVWRLLHAPEGMSLDAEKGLLRWLPMESQLGTHNVELQVGDALGATVSQQFSVSVRATDLPPEISSFPTAPALVGIEYSYDIEAIDAEGDEITFSVTGPTGMVINSEGQLTWTPGAEDVGEHEVDIRVSDGANTTGQRFLLPVRVDAADGIPVISSFPSNLAAVGALYEYSVIATDPDSTALTFELRQAPTGMTVDADGVIQWTPTPGQIGDHEVELIVKNVAGGLSGQSFPINVIQNNAPVFESTPDESVSAGAVYRYDAIASDANNDPLTFQLLSGPDNLSVNDSGQLRWLTHEGDIGEHEISIQVSDARGGSAQQNFVIEVTADVTAPQLNLAGVPESIALNSSFRVMVQASDDVAVTKLSLKVNGTPVILDNNQAVTLEFAETGTVALLATAEDAAGNRTELERELLVFDPTDTDAPKLQISNLDDDTIVTAITDVIGSVEDDNLQHYTFSVASFDGQFKEIFRSDQTVTDGVLATFDPSILPNDTYFLRLAAIDTGGNESSIERFVHVSSDLKLGDFTLTFNDLSLNLGGIPITVARTYDSLTSESTGDFGYGWRMEFRDVQLTATERATGLEDVGVYPGFRFGTRVYLTLPGGRREGFTFKPRLGDSPFERLLGMQKPYFEPDPGVNSTLSVPEVLLSAYSDGTFGNGSIRYNPLSPAWAGFLRLSTEEGASYIIDGPTGKIQSLIDQNGNSLLFSDSGIVSTAGGQSIDFERDTQGRISAVIDPAGNRVEYEYDNKGDLVGVTDRSGNKSLLRYDDGRQHYLTEVIDPLGRTGVRAEYDDQGRLVGVVDALGNATQFAYEPENSLVKVEDQRGFTTTYEYDSFGNVVSEVDPLGGTTRRTYEDPVDPTLETSVTDPLGNTTHYEHDRFGNVTKETSPTGQVRSTLYRHYNTNSFEIAEKNLGSLVDALRGRGSFTATFDAVSKPSANQPYSLPISTVDALGNATTSKYDDKGNLLETIDADGLVTAIDYLGPGLPERISIGSNSTEFKYHPNGLVSSQIDAAGHENVFTYDENGNQVTEQFVFIDPNGMQHTVITTNEYDDEGRQIGFTTLQGDDILSSGRTVYDSVGNMTETIDALGRSTIFIYDQRGLLLDTILPDETPEDLSDNLRRTTSYDDAGNILTETDEGGRKTRYEYDELGRRNKTILPHSSATDPEDNDPSDNPTLLTIYDLAGQVIGEIDPLGNQTDFVFDAEGDIIETILPDETPEDSSDNPRVRDSYDQAGRRTDSTDPLGNTTRFVYSDSGLPVETILPDDTESITDNSRSFNHYDTNRQLIGRTDANGIRTDYEYDASGRLSAVVQVLSDLAGTQKTLRTEYKYDTRGNLTVQRDALGRETRYEYDALDRRTATILPDDTPDDSTDNFRNHVQYDTAGRVLAATDFNGQTIQYSYDTLDRLTEKQFSDSSTTSYSYSPTGQVNSVVDARGTTLYAYDFQDRLLSRTDPDGSEISYAYDLAGNRTEVVTKVIGNTERRTLYEFDAQNRQSKVTDPEGLATTYEYDVAGRLTRTAFPNGNIELRVFDSQSRLLSIETQNAAGELLAGYEYQLDAAGNRQSVVERTDTETRLVDYAYDDLYRLIGETVYENVVDLDDPGTPDRTTTYRYDEVGNRLARDDSSEGETLYEYDVMDRLTLETLAGDSTRYEYDPNGNQLRQIDSATDSLQSEYFWDSENRLIAADTDGDGSLDVEYEYDSDGIRVSKFVGDETTRYLLDANRPYQQVLEEYTPGGIIKVSYVHGIDLISQNRPDETGKSFYHVDGLGSTRALGNESGLITDRYIYDAFGRTIGQVGSTGNLYLYAGEQRDYTLQLDYLRARYLDFQAARFARRDTFEGFELNPATLNKYVYANNSPTILVDPTGLLATFDLASLNVSVGVSQILTSVSPIALNGTNQLLAAYAIKVGLEIRGLGTVFIIAGATGGEKIYRNGQEIVSLASAVAVDSSKGIAEALELQNLGLKSIQLAKVLNGHEKYNLAEEGLKRTDLGLKYIIKNIEESIVDVDGLPLQN